MAPRPQRETILAAIVVLLGLATYGAYQTWLRPSASTAVASNEGGRPSASSRTTRAATGETAAAGAPQVHLDALGEHPASPDPAGRDLFRFRMKPPPPTPVGPQPAPLPPGPPPVAPISLKFIGVVDAPPPQKRVAVLSDGRGAPVYGHEGDTVLGQYRILRIGAESIEMAYLDGRGRQTIRLSGS
jgi:hypothetical protein